MGQVGKPIKKIVVEPLENPVPSKEPVKTPTPEKVPA